MSDADGNTLTDTSGRAMTWDSQNRLASCTKAGVTSTYTYGADGLRRSSTVNGVTTYYAYDGQTMIREMRRSPTTGALMSTATYLQGPRGGECRVDETAVTESYTDPTTGNSGVRGVTRWYVYDGLGSVVGEVAGDAAGTMTSSPKYDVYGATRSNAGATSTRQGFVGGLGHVSDSETGLIYMRARYYDPSLGRFVSEDPGVHGNNWYIYCDDNPINKVDVNGKVPAFIAAMIFGAAVGMGIYLMECAYKHQTPTVPGFIQAAILGAVAALITFAAVVVAGEFAESAAILSFANGAIGGLEMMVLAMVGFDAGMFISVANHALGPILTHILGIEAALAECDSDS